ncbi:fatty acyl-AMP ligase [Spongiactinospora sp. TRM90649]|uniref:fatty acyl-AMP ligase n=1 Tax=Spongiactinospora sp. TRM90649 TaxID=3031114 RepID=UPI0023F8D1D2|nr:fatty acyl-AMP ligase [Spongiactinospora sp. TRM90649]MDF5752448.1 fatty acyl-AMP ligase [Spongiactinospora sp. TRM90649]
MRTIPLAPTLTETISLRAAENGSSVAYRFLPDGENESHALTFAELERGVRGLAARLARHTSPGDRAIILAPDADAFIRAFLACQYAGVIAVPVYPPMPFETRRNSDTLRAITRDCAPTTVIYAAPEEYRELILARTPELAAPYWLDATEPGDDGDGFEPVPVSPDDLSFLQYTSGSTALPKGVMISHRALMHQEELLRQVGRFSTDSVVVSWLPLFHDMGLIGNVLAALYNGCQAVLMPPPAFVQRPVRWLRAISRYRATISGGPNFAYELSVRRIPPEDRAGLDLSSLVLAFNGAEPVRAATLDAFTHAYRPYGLGEQVLYPCYGLAELTLMATGSPIGTGSVVRSIRLDALQEGRLVHGGDHRAVGSGRAMEGHRKLAIVDPETSLRLPEGRVGEIWVAGPDMADGYWNRPQESEQTFGARIADTGEGPFLRTGDLGVLDDGELFVVGRLKDLVIVGGRNHYPQDIEATVESAHPLVRRGCVVAFGSTAQGAERLVVVAEIKPVSTAGELTAIRRALGSAVAAAHGAQVGELLLTEAGTIPKTSSGKLQRRACAAAWERGELTPASAREAEAVR